MKSVRQLRLILGLTVIAGALLGMTDTAHAQDLYIKDYQVGVTGTTVTYQVTACNQGSSTTKSFDLEIYYNLSYGTTPGCGTVQSQTYTFSSGLSYGACTTRTFTRYGASSGFQRSWARVDADCDVSETNESNNNSYKSYTVGSSLPNYYVSTFTASTSGTTVTYTAKVCNAGGSSTKAFDLEIYYHLSSEPGCTSTQSQTYRFTSGMAKGACTTRTFTRTGASTGTYYAWARADADCEVTESNELNNNRYYIYSVKPAKPDLYVSSFTTSVSGTTVTYTTTVCNGGSTTTTSFDIELFYNRSSAPTCTSGASQQYVMSSGLAAGKCYTKSFTRTSTSAGSYVGWVAVDADCKVAESSETNNTRYSIYKVGATLPDLRVSTFNVSASGTTVTYSAKVCNYGGATTQAFYLEIYYNLTSAPTCTTTNSRSAYFSTGLGAGACSTKTFTRTGVTAGSYTGWARADANCAVTESSETNNNASQSYSVGKPDYYVSSLTTSVSGTTVTYTAKVCNAGTSSKSSFAVGLYYNRSTTPTCSIKPNQYYTQSTGLPSGACTTKTFTYTGAAVGSYRAWVMADSGCAVSEAKETNNAAYKNYDVGPTTPNLAISTFTVSVTGTSVVYVIKACNLGKAIPSGTSFKVELYYDRVSSPGCTSSASRTSTISTGLGYNACITRSFSRAGASSGSFTAWARVDADCAITESTELDNNMSKPYSVGTVAKPELYVSAFDAVVTGSSVSYDATVCNAGATSGSFTLGIYYNSNSGPTCGGSKPDQTYVFTAGLTKGTCTKKTFVRPGATAGTFTGWAFADSACKVSETTETNNTASKAYTVVNQTPDLYVSNFSVTSAKGSTELEATVCNQGKATAPATSVGVFANRSTAPSCSDTPDATLNIKSLAASGCDTQKTTLTALAAGPYVAWALADPKCAVTESDETNNTIADTYVVPAPPVDAGVNKDMEVTPDGIQQDTMAKPDMEKNEEDAGATTQDSGPSKTDNGGTSTDTGTVQPPDGGDDGSCNCTAASANAPALPGSSLLLALIMGLALLIRRRRK